MISKPSPRRVAAFVAAAFLLSLAPVRPASAQTSTRYMAKCTAFTPVGAGSAQCTVTVPAGKVFIIESATVGGYIQLGQLQVWISTKMGASTFFHTVPSGFQVPGDPLTWWNGAIPGTIFGEAGPIKLMFARESTAGPATLSMTLSGRLEDL